MKVVLSPRAARDLDSQIQYLIDQGAACAARKLKARVLRFLRLSLATYPKIGVEIEHRDLRECWIPGTRLLVWYRIAPDQIEIARFWHTSHDRDATSER